LFAGSGIGGVLVNSSSEERWRLLLRGMMRKFLELQLMIQGFSGAAGTNLLWLARAD
jgi:hypothetical protein